MEREGPNASATIHGHSSHKVIPVDKANAIADYLENQFAPHDL
jgi:hypothetical protein